MSKKKDLELENAAKEWSPDSADSSGSPASQDSRDAADAAAAQPHAGATTDSPSPNGYVSIIRDPFGIPTLDIAEAQERTDELVLDEVTDFEEPLEIDDSTKEADLASLAAVMKSEEKLHEEELKLVTAAAAEDSAARLAAEIAEDEALARKLAEEAEAEGEIDEELRAALPRAPEKDENGELDLREVESCIEAMLFMVDKPITVNRLRELLGPDFSHSIFQEALTSLKLRYQGLHHGIELVEVAGGYQFRTKPGRAPLARKLAKIQTQRLSTGAMESLAIVAYRQPVMKDDIDKIRGVDSSHFIRGLLEKKLIRISGRSELPGRPMLYTTSPEFLELFGLKDLSAMPSLRELEQMVPMTQTRNPEDEDPRVKEMRRLVGEMKTDTSTQLNYDPREDDEILKSIREKVNAIPTSTPYLDAQKEAAKQAELAAKLEREPLFVPAAAPELPDAMLSAAEEAGRRLVADSAEAGAEAHADAPVTPEIDSGATPGGTEDTAALPTD